MTKRKTKCNNIVIALNKGLFNTVLLFSVYFFELLEDSADELNGNVWPFM